MGTLPGRILLVLSSKLVPFDFVCGFCFTMKGVVPVATMADLIAKKQRFESRTPASRDLLSPRSPVPQLSNKVKREQGSGEKVKGPSRVKAEILEVAESGAPAIRRRAGGTQ